MKRITISIIVCIILILGAYTSIGEINTNEIKSTIKKNSSQPEEVTLITEDDYQRVIEVDINYNTIWQKTGLYFPIDSERL